MAELKTRQTEADVNHFLSMIDNEKKRADSASLVAIMSEVTGEKPKIWGSGIIGFGNYHYKSAAGSQGDWFLAGIAPRKQNISIYLMAGYVSAERPEYEVLLKKLGKYKMGKGCMYINKLEDIDVGCLKKLIEISVAYLRDKYKTV